jgi:hypothetical protein
VRVFGILDLKPRIFECTLLYDFRNRIPIQATHNTILIHGLLHILDYIHITILCYANIVITLPVVRKWIIMN